MVADARTVADCLDLKDRSPLTVSSASVQNWPAVRLSGLKLAEKCEQAATLSYGIAVNARRVLGGSRT